MAKDYYNGNDCFEAMGSVLTPEELRGFCVGNAFKYIWRHHSKGGREDLEKAADYLQRALELPEPAATCYNCDASMDEPNDSDDRPVNVGKSGVWMKVRGDDYGCPFCGQIVTLKDDDRPEMLTCPRCLAVLSFEEGNDKIKWHYPPESPDDTDLCLFEVEKMGSTEDGFHLGYHDKTYSRWNNELGYFWCYESKVKRWMKVEDIMKEADNDA